MNPYQNFVADFARLVRESRQFPLGQAAPLPKPEFQPGAPKALLFAPHPDDECIIGGMALRVMRELKWPLINVAVTQGSNKQRQPERFRELKNACDFLGFGLVQTAPNGLERVNPKTRQQDAAHWTACVAVIARILQDHRPRVIFFPHEQDWNSTHIGTHHLVMDALATLTADFECFLVETEFWGPMADPNLMVESSAADVADLVTATSFHVGEVRRNPYHLLLPAWLMDNVRRGGELVGGQGGAAPDFSFATLYRLRKWAKGRPERFYAGGKQLPAGANIGGLLA